MSRVYQSMIIVMIAVSIHLYLKNITIKEENSSIKEENYAIKEKLNDPNFNKRRAMEAFEKAENWRVSEAARLYADVTDDDLDNASRWISYAEPFAAQRSCMAVAQDVWLGEDLMGQIKSRTEQMWQRSESVSWNESCRKAFLVQYAFHTTGIEGNTLTLTETSLVINNQSLLAGFGDNYTSFVTPMTQQSVIEIRNIQHVADALGLSGPSTGKESWSFTQLGIVDINAAITRDLGTPSGFRRHQVAIGHQHIVLPMPDEVPALVSMYMKWINLRLRDLIISDESSLAVLITKALALACDAHTRLVHIHPFADGNGRLARVVSGLVLQKFQLPLPMFVKEAREEYIRAVGAATIDTNYGHLCRLHAEGVLRSLSIINRLFDNSCAIP